MTLSLDVENVIINDIMNEPQTEREIPGQNVSATIMRKYYAFSIKIYKQTEMQQTIMPGQGLYYVAIINYAGNFKC